MYDLLTPHPKTTMLKHEISLRMNDIAIKLQQNDAQMNKIYKRERGKQLPFAFFEVGKIEPLENKPQKTKTSD